MAKAIQARHPGIELTVLSHSSIDILRSLEEFSIDVGLTYLDNEPIEGMRAEGDLYGALLPAGARRPRAGQGVVGDLGRSGEAAAVPVDARHAEPAHHRPRLPRRQRHADPAGSRPIR